MLKQINKKLISQYNEEIAHFIEKLCFDYS